MEWLNLHTSALDSPEVITASAAQRGTWLNLLRYCIGQENGGRIIDAGDWGPNKWLMVVRVDPAEIDDECELWWWEQDTLVVAHYPLDAEKSVQAKREAGKRGGARKTQAKTQAAKQNGQMGGRPSLNGQAFTQGETEKPKQNPSITQAKTQRKEKKGKEKKGNVREEELQEIRVEPGLGGPCSLAHETTTKPIAAMKTNPDDTVAASPPPPRPPIDVNALYDSIFIEPDRKAKEAAAREVAALKAQMKPQLDAARRKAEDAYADELAAQREKEREEDAAAEAEERERGDYY
jgi:hypothetical protein